MIRVQCDRCENELIFPDSRAGEKVECPECGDVNRLPARASVGAAEPGVTGVTRAPDDRASARGLPADAGPEMRVLLVHPSLVRSKPIVSGALLLAPIALATALLIWIPAEHRPLWLLVAPAMVAWPILLAWWLSVRWSASIEITNKRTVLRRGVLRRSSSEVLHDHVRNIEIDQSFADRVCRVGKIGISSSGQDGIEVAVDRIPNPRGLREIIDLYRPL